MFDETFFKTHLQTHITAKAKEGADQPSLIIRLHSGLNRTGLIGGQIP